MKKLLEKIGKEALVQMTSSGKQFVNVRVLILDIKQSYGRTRYLVKPVAGEGEMWVENLEGI